MQSIHKLFGSEHVLIVFPSRAEDARRLRPMTRDHDLHPIDVKLPELPVFSDQRIG